MIKFLFRGMRKIKNKDQNGRGIGKKKYDGEYLFI